MRVLFFAGSLRTASLNKKFVKVAQGLVQKHFPSVETQYLDLEDFPMEIYDGDIEAASGIPDATVKLGKLIREAQAIVISTPEYNGSISGVLKNTIDWLSREKPHAIAGKHFLLLAASPGVLGGVRGLWHSRNPLEALGGHVYPTMMGLGSAGNKFDASEKLNDAKAELQLENWLQAFINFAKR